MTWLKKKFKVWWMKNICGAICPLCGHWIILDYDNETLYCENCKYRWKK